MKIPAELAPYLVSPGALAKECPVCYDTYDDLWEHLASGRKNCGPILIHRGDVRHDACAFCTL